jgi:peptide/nickel transport system substrate-binding protein
MHLLKHLAIALVASAITTAVPSSSFAGPDTNIAIIGAANEPVTLDPAAGNTGFDYPYLYSIYDRLIHFVPETLELVPGIATEWGFEGENNQTFRMMLREDMRFHDGTSVNAEAVKSSLLHFKETSSRGFLDVVDEIEIVDDHTLLLHLNQEYSVLPAVLADRAGMISSPTAREKHGEDFGRNPVGAGPFRLSDWSPGESIELETFSDYGGVEEPRLDGVEFRIITSQTAMVSALIAGQIDQAFSLDPKNLALLRANPRIRVNVEPTLFYYQLMLNTTVSPIDDPLVRQALNISVDREALAKAVLGEDVSEGPAFAPVPPSHWASTPELADEIKYDPERARELLAEAGHPDGITFKICGTPTVLGYDTNIVDIEREQMKAAGINLEATMLAGNACQQAWATTGEYHARQGGFTGRPDPFLTYHNQMGSDGRNNRGKIPFEGVDETLNKLLTTYDREGQDKLFDELNRLWHVHVPHVLLFYGSNVSAYANNLVGERPNAQGKLNPVSFYFEE